MNCINMQFRSYWGNIWENYEYCYRIKQQWQTTIRGSTHKGTAGYHVNGTKPSPSVLLSTVCLPNCQSFLFRVSCCCHFLRLSWLVSFCILFIWLGSMCSGLQLWYATRAKLTLHVAIWETEVQQVTQNRWTAGFGCWKTIFHWCCKLLSYCQREKKAQHGCKINKFIFTSTLLWFCWFN